jgi:hypothetical protein
MANKDIIQNCTQDVVTNTIKGSINCDVVKKFVSISFVGAAPNCAPWCMEACLYKSDEQSSRHLTDKNAEVGKPVTKLA